MFSTWNIREKNKSISMFSNWKMREKNKNKRYEQVNIPET